MSLYSEIKLPVPDEESALLLAISNQPDNISLAVGTQTRIIFFSDTGDLKNYQYRKNVEPVAMEYHPNYSVLAIGWRNGMISLYSEESKLAKEEQNIHKAAITLVAFHKAGQRMLSADASGVIVCWKGMNALVQLRQSGSINHAMFVTLSLEGDSQKDKNKNMFLFLYGGQSGSIYYGEESAKSEEICSLGSSVQALMYYEKKNHVLAISSGLLFIQFRLFSDKPPERKQRIAIAGSPEKIIANMFEGSCFALTSNEGMVRIWNLEEDVNYNLTLADATASTGAIKVLSGKILNSVYHRKNRTLLCGTSDGRVLAWKNMGPGEGAPAAADHWKIMPSINLDNSVLAISTSTNSPCIAFKYGSMVAMAHQIVIRGAFSEKIMALQVASGLVQVYKVINNSQTVLTYDTKSNIRYMDVHEDRMALWNGKHVEIYNIQTGGSPFLWLLIVKKIENGIQPNLVVQFPVKDPKGNFIALASSMIIYVTDYVVYSLAEDGSEKSKLQFPASEGSVCVFNKVKNFIVTVTTENLIRIFDISTREIKQVSISRRFENSQGPLGVIRDAKLNANGDMVAIIATHPSEPPPKQAPSHPVAKRGPAKKPSGPDLPQAKAQAKNEPEKEVPTQVQTQEKKKDVTEIFIYNSTVDTFFSYRFQEHLVPTQIVWDRENSAFMGVFLRNTKEEAKVQDEDLDETVKSKLHTKCFSTFFVSEEVGIKNHDMVDLEESDESVMSINVPYIILIKKDVQNAFLLHFKSLKEFVGIENINVQTKNAILNFNYYLTIGNMDEAYKAVKNIQNPLIWENMARMCVKTRRLDVAEICMANIKFARGAKAVREVKNESADVQIAMVAIQLNMKEEAETILKEAGRFDLLNELYQAGADWKAAEELAQKSDRISLKNTYYQIAKNFEVSKEYDKAIEYYEKSGNHLRDVPRMLMQAREYEQLKAYIDRKKEPELYKFWGQYLEAQQINLREALEYYKQSEDYENVVRLCVQLGDIAMANKVCIDTGNPSACLMMARFYEGQNDVNSAISLYAKGEHYNHSVRLAKENGLDNDLMMYALQASRNTMLQCAKYFEGKGFIEKSVVLYIKGQNLKKASDLAMKHKLYDYVKQISAETENTKNNDPENVNKMVDFFMSSGQYDKVVPLLVAKGEVAKALDLCIQENIPINEELMKKMIPEDMDEATKRQTIEVIAVKARKQGNFSLAFKLNMQLSLKTKAVKCLIDQGDTSTLIKFAVNARDPEIYVLAANYLQTTNWYENNEVRNSILSFYQKAKAFDRMAGFFEYASSIEIDDYREYEKAFATLQEALKWAQKASDSSKEERIAGIKRKMEAIQNFNNARNSYVSNPQMMLTICEGLLQKPSINDMVRVGDILTLIFEYHFSKKNMPEAYQIILKMKERGLPIGDFIELDKAKEVMSANGVETEKKPEKIKKFDPLAAKSKMFGDENGEDAGGHFEEEEIEDDL